MDNQNEGIDVSGEKNVNSENSLNSIDSAGSVSSVDTKNSAGSVNSVSTENVTQITKKSVMQNNVFIIFGMPLLFLLFTIVAALPLGVMSAVTGTINIAAALIVTAIAEVVVIFAYIAYTKDKIPLDWKRKLGFQNFSIKWIILSVIIGILTFGLLQVSQTTLVNMLDIDVASSETSTNVLATEGLTRYLTLILLVPIMAPVIEEILFRGAVFNGLLLGKVPVFWSFIIGSFAFAIVHFQGFSSFTDIFTVCWIFVVALINCAVFYKTRSVYNTMALHVAYNGITVILSLLLM